jgi:hypothetical protein
MKDSRLGFLQSSTAHRWSFDKETLVELSEASLTGQE